MKCLLGVDIGGTNIKAGLVSLDGRIMKKVNVPAEADKGEATFLENIKRAIRSVASDDVAGIGIGCPGPLDTKRGIILNPPNIPFRNLRLGDIIQEEFGVPVKVDNDANCFVLGEAVFGKARNASVVVGMTLGTGFGGGAVVNKEIFHGSGNAAEFWFSTINFDGIRGKIANTGAVEEYVSKRGIMRLANNLDVKEPLDIYEMAKKGDSGAVNVFEKFGRYLGVFIVNTISFFDPGAIVVGGKIARSNEFFANAMKREIEKAPFNNADIHFIHDTHRSAVIGAASLLLQDSTIKESTGSVSKTGEGKVSMRRL